MPRLYDRSKVLEKEKRFSEGMRRCTKCNAIKSLSGFYKLKRGFKGYDSRCKECIAAPFVTESRIPIVDGRKECTRCHKWKYLSEFSVDRKVISGRASWCQHCWKLNNLYHVTSEVYDTLLEVQNGACAICGSTTPNGKSSRYFHVDHDHVSGKVRGLLCHSCNIGISHFRDKPDRLQKAIEYLTRY